LVGKVVSMARLASFFVIALLTAGSASAAQGLADGDWLGEGVGTSTCGEFAKAYRGDPKVAELVYFS
jgi:hypothetical protein